jgi:penicillin-binding protein 2
VEENQASLPGVSVQAEPVPYYPYGKLAANILGYVSQITASEYSDVKRESCGPGIPCYQPNSQVGQAGVEESFEQYLRGTPGVERMQVDSQGHVLSVDPLRAPVPGDDIILSISLQDQQAAEQALAQWTVKARELPADQVSGEPFRATAASMVVEDPRNGQVLALATYPDYNPNDFTGGISEARWAYYNNPANNYPLEDRAISGEYAPGSTWKLVTATAMLRYGLRTPYTIYDDLGSYKIGGQTFLDNDSQALGPVDLAQAITQSSDTYFYSIGGQFYQEFDAGRQLKGPDPLQEVASQFGLGHYSGIDLPGESPGLVPDAQIVAKLHAEYPKDYPDGNWEPGFEVQEAIGEGQDLVTPLQLADAYGAFANGGTLYVPEVVLAVEAPGPAGKPSNKVTKRFFPKVKDHVAISSGAGQAAMIQGFEGVTGSSLGTAYGAFQGFPLDKYPVAGKTGTAQVDSYCGTGTKCAAGFVPWPAYKQDTSVFASFAPTEAPRFVVDAVFEQAGYGASVAAPAVAQEYETLFGLNEPAATTTTSSGTANSSTTSGSTAGAATGATTTAGATTAGATTAGATTAGAGTAGGQG